MIYFVNTNIDFNKSGIEHAELKRINLFKKHQTVAKIITTEWNTNFHQICDDAGLTSSDLLSLFDYYQDRCHVSKHKVTINQLDFGISNMSVQDDLRSNRYLLYRPDGSFLGRVNYDPNRGKQVMSTELFDGYGNLYCVHNYDSRGFDSEVDWYSPDNKIDRKEWFNANGEVVIQEFFQFNLARELVNTGWWLKDHDDKEYTFDTSTEFLTKFFNDVNSIGQNIFVIDRALSTDEAFLHLDKPAYLAYHMHNSQGADSQDEMHSDLNNNYEFGLYNIDKYQAIISATPNQTEDLIARFHPQKAHMFTIPVGIVPDSQLKATQIPESARTFGKVIIAARISSEKQIPKIVNSIALVHKQVPEVTFDIWGYTNSIDEKQAILNAAKNGGIEKNVYIKGYSENIGKVYDTAQIFTLASTMEGFNLAIMEACSHGVVGVTYDTNYGPNSIIEDGKNGYVVPYNNEQAMADRIVKLLKDPELLQEMSNNAYQLSNRYSADSVWKQWEQLITDANNYFQEE